jgi:hypothetical protein
MIKTKALPVILRVVSKLDIKPIISKLKGLDLKSAESGTLSSEDMAILAFEVFSEVIPQLGKIEHDIVQFIADIKDIPIKEAEQLSALVSLQEIFADKELLDFFKSALTKKAER